MIASFRLRLALSAALLTGVALAVFGLSTFWLIRDARIEHLDRTLRSHAEREAGRPARDFDWRRVEFDTAASLGVHDPGDLLLVVQDGAGRGAYRSARWPASLDASSLPWPQPPPPRLGAPAPPPPRPGAADRADRDDRPERPDRRERRPRPATASVGQDIDGSAWRIGLATGEASHVAVAVSLRTIDAEMQGIRTAFLVAAPIALLLIGLSAWILSQRALRPVQKLSAAARKVTAAGLDQRLPIAGEDREFVELIDVFNGMLERLERSFGQAHRFTSDAAHELKTPLAILQGQLERAIHAAEAGSKLQEELTGILDEVRRLSTISRKLLLLSRADAGRLNLHREPFALSTALAELVEDTRMLAPELAISADIEPDLVVAADGSLLTQALHNLISNAIKYNVDRGWIRLAARSLPRGEVEVRVANASAGIPPEEREKIFERFYRADRAHGRNVDGVGLGLALSREIARAHGGELSLAAGAVGVVEFSLRLPRGQ
jgi:heavy metal sensor kinase